MAEAETPTATKELPIVSFLHLPEKAGEDAYLAGSRCPECGAAYLGSRMACGRCFYAEALEDIQLSKQGKLHVFSIVHQSVPGVPVPYIAAIVDLPEGVSVRCNIEGVEPDPKQLKSGMPVEMYTEKVHTDRDGNDIIAFKFRPVNGGSN
jgi:uncharacterized OB-fold protein